MLGKKKIAFLEEKIREYEKLSGLIPESHRTYQEESFPEPPPELLKGLNFLKEGYFTEASAFFESFSRSYSSDPNFLCLLSDSYACSGKLQKAISILESYSSEYLNIFLAKKLANLYQKTGNNKLAISKLVEIVNVSQTDIDAIIKLTYLYIAESLYSDAVKTLKMVLRFFPLDAKYNLLLALCYIELGQYLQAIEILNHSLIRNPNSDEIISTLGGAYFYCNQLDKAVDCYNQAIELNDQKIDHYLNLALCYEKLNKPENAFEILKRIPDDCKTKQIRIFCAELFIKIKKPYNALIEIMEIKKEDTEAAWNIMDLFLADEELFSSQTAKNDQKYYSSEKTILKGLDIFIHMRNLRNTYHSMMYPGGLKRIESDIEMMSGKWKDVYFEISESTVNKTGDWFRIDDFISLIDSKNQQSEITIRPIQPKKDEKYYYTLLEINKTASISEIKNAYKKKLKQYHPDKVASLGKELQKKALEITLELTEAYEFLRKRRRF